MIAVVWLVVPDRVLSPTTPDGHPGTHHRTPAQPIRHNGVRARGRGVLRSPRPREPVAEGEAGGGPADRRRIRHRYRISVAEVGHQDQWQRAAIAVAVVAESDGQVLTVLADVERYVALRPTVELLDVEAASLENVTPVTRRGRICPAPVSALGPGQRGGARSVGDELERLTDPRLGLVTVTGVEVTPDLRQATVYYSALGRAKKRGTGVVPEIEPEQQESTQAALEAAASHLRTALGRQVRLKYRPCSPSGRTPPSQRASGSRRSSATSTRRASEQDRGERVERGRGTSPPRRAVAGAARSRWPVT